MTIEIESYCFLFSVLLALAGWLRDQHIRFLWYSGTAVLIFRAELALYLGQILIIELFFKRLTIQRLLKNGIPAAVFLVGM